MNPYLILIFTDSWSRSWFLLTRALFEPTKNPSLGSNVPIRANLVLVPVLQVGDPVFMGFCETCKVSSRMMGATTTVVVVAVCVYQYVGKSKYKSSA